MTASSRNGDRRIWFRWSEALLATSMLVLVPVMGAAPALADGWGCAPADSPILHGTSTPIALTAPPPFTIADSTSAEPGGGATLTKVSATTHTFSSTAVDEPDRESKFDLQFTITATNKKGSNLVKTVKCSVGVVHLGTSTLVCTPATQTISHSATATVTLAPGASITKFTWAASATPAGRLALAPAAGNETALAITGTPVTDVHVDETITVNIKASVTEAVVGGKAKKLKPVTANLACAVAVVHRT